MRQTRFLGAQPLFTDRFHPWGEQICYRSINLSVWKRVSDRWKELMSETVHLHQLSFARQTDQAHDPR